MRPLRSSAASRLVAGCLVLLGLGRAAGAQKGTAVEGALDFLLPIGARSVGMGQTVVASASGSDAIWWNPALLAGGPREFALHLEKNASATFETDAALAIVLPVNRVGAFALSIRYLNSGTQAATDEAGNVIGSFATSTSIFAGTFAPALTDRLSGGITFKLLRNTFSSSGGVNDPAHAPQTAAVDLGFHYLLMKDSTVTIGASLRNLGPKLQVNDSPQSDALPARADVGVSYAPKYAQLPKEARLRFGADMVSYVSGGTSPGFRVGGEFSWLERYEARAGYVASGPTGSGPTFGFGISTGKLQIDIAQMLSDLALSGSTPTFLTLRYRF
jgi:hypothetical protein